MAASSDFGNLPQDAATTPLGEIVILSAAALFMGSAFLWFVLKRVRDRPQRIRGIAEARGAHYSRLDDDRISGVGFPVFHIARSAQRRSVVRVYNVVTATLPDSTWVRGFDFDVHQEDVLVSLSARNRLAIERGRSTPGAATKHIGRKTRGTRTAAYVCLDADLPPMVVGRKLDGWERVGQQIASRSHGAPFDVYSPDPKFARMFMSSAISNLMVEHKHLVLETYGAYVVVHGAAARPAHVIERMRAAARVSQLVSDEVHRMFVPKTESWRDRYHNDVLAGRVPASAIPAEKQPGGAAPPRSG